MGFSEAIVEAISTGICGQEGGEEGGEKGGRGGGIRCIVSMICPSSQYGTWLTIDIYVYLWYNWDGAHVLNMSQPGRERRPAREHVRGPSLPTRHSPTSALTHTATTFLWSDQIWSIDNLARPLFAVLISCKVCKIEKRVGLVIAIAISIEPKSVPNRHTDMSTIDRTNSIKFYIL